MKIFLVIWAKPMRVAWLVATGARQGQIFAWGAMLVLTGRTEWPSRKRARVAPTSASVFTAAPLVVASAPTLVANCGGGASAAPAAALGRRVKITSTEN